MRKVAFLAPVALASLLALSACSASIKGDGPLKGNPTDSASASGAPVQQSGESAVSFEKRSKKYDDIKSGGGSQISYDCADGPWSSTESYKTVILRGHCTDVNIAHSGVSVLVSKADRINVAAGGSSSKVVANQIGTLTIADSYVTVYSGTLGDVTIAPAGKANSATVYTGTIGSKVTVQANYADIYYDEGMPSVTTTGSSTNVRQN